MFKTYFFCCKKISSVNFSFCKTYIISSMRLMMGSMTLCRKKNAYAGKFHHGVLLTYFVPEKNIKKYAILFSQDRCRIKTHSELYIY